MSPVARRLLAAMVLGTAVPAVLLGVARIGAAAHLLRAFEARTYDLRMAGYRGAVVPAGAALDDVVIVDIDEASLAELGQFCRWPRAWHAAVIDSLTAAGAVAIGFDVLFPESDGLPPGVVAEHVRRLARDGQDEARLRQMLAALSTDGVLGEAARRSGRVLFGLQVERAADGAAHAVLPVAAVAAGASGFGHVHLLPDADGVVRRVPVFLEADGRRWLSLGVRLALAARGLSPEPVRLDADGVVRGPGWSLPTDGGGEMLVDFAGPPGTFLRVSYADVLRGRAPRVLFAGRVVLVGATASGLMDSFAAPFDTHVPGVEIHANAIHDILEGRFVRHATPALDLVALWLASLAAALAVLFLRPHWALLACAAALAALVLACFEGFAGAGVWVALVLPAGGWAASAAAASAYRYWTEERAKLAIKQAFGRYLAPQVVEQIAAAPERLRLGGDERLLTVGFVDVRDFTTLAEGLSAPQLATFLNDYLSAMTAHILAEEGTVDKYIGDAIMMLFGAPNAMDDQAQRACRTALAMARTVAARQEAWRRHGLRQPLRIGVGLNTGPAAVGNMGSAFRFDYTAMGDSVNLASRLEGLNKVYGTQIVLGPGTAAAVRTTFALRELDLVRVKGKREPVRIYELLDPEPAPPWVALFEEGLAQFRQRRWAAARERFECCLRQQPGDGPSSHYLRLALRLAADPPGDDWDGVSVMEQK